MPVAAGTRLGQYEILAPIGTGGMGEVYRAKDTKLKREVALKVLPESFAGDPERMARFQREAEVLASLNHPNIAQIYGVEERALVMELVEGQTLEGPLPLETALNYARQIGDALEAAHDKGIIHRDLKPANIMITPAGVVKVLDFGLAALPNRDREGADSVNSPTLTISPTRAGMILGTAGYMSPEQARGKAVDKRADIWAFGVVLYEMLTGKRLFEGETVSDTLAQVLTKEPDWEQVPAKVRRLLEACLQKDPKQRLQAIGDWRLLLTDLQPQAIVPSQRLTWVLAAAAVALAIALTAVSFRHFRETPPAPPVLVRFEVADPALNLGDMAPSPDGRALVYTGVGPDAARRLWIRSFDSLDSRVLPGTEGASSPFWSPDGRFVGFAEGPRLKKIDSSGVAPPETLCDIGNGTVGPGSWNSEGVIIFGGGGSGPLHRVSADGGTVTEITALSEGEINHTDPAWLPDGRHFLYTRVNPNQPAATYLGSLDAKATEQRNQRVLMTGSRFVPAAQSGGGYLLFLRGTTLMAQPFDTSRLELAGAPAPVAAQVGVNNENGFFAGSAAALAYRTGAGRIRQLAWYDRKGAVLGTVGNPASYLEVELSPDGSRAAAFDFDDQQDIWLFDLARNASTRLTFDPGPERCPLWSPDASQIVFTSNGARELYRKAANGGGMELLLKSPEQKYPQDWSRDGRYLMYVAIDAKKGADLWVLPLKGERKPAKVLATPFYESQARFSPDGRWIVHRSNESGSVQIYVRPFVLPGSSSAGTDRGKWMISNGGGYQPRWRRDGKEILYLSPSGQMMSVEVKSTGDSFQAAKPTPLFDAIPDMASTQLVTTLWDMTPDGQRFLLNTTAANSKASPITVVLNWQAGLKK